MNDAQGAGANAPVVIHNHPPRQPWFGRTLIRLALIVSIGANVFLFARVSAYFSSTVVEERFLDGDQSATDKIAVIAVRNMITSDTIAAPKRELRHAAEDQNVKAVVLAVDSPGGTIAGSDALYHAVEEFRKKTERKKPLIVWMQGIAASGAYYISVPADKIIAEPSCVTGSIGVIASMFTAEKLLDKIGVTPEVIKSGAMKDSGSPFRSMNAADRAEWQKLIAGMYDQFLDVVVKHRGEKIGGRDKLKAIADGRVYLAKAALELKLVDAIGYEEDAIAEAKRMAGLTEKVKIVTFSRPFTSLWSLLDGKAPSGSTMPAIDANLLLDLQTPRLLYMPTPVVGLGR